MYCNRFFFLFWFLIIDKYLLIGIQIISYEKSKAITIRQLNDGLISFYSTFAIFIFVVVRVGVFFVCQNKIHRNAKRKYIKHKIYATKTIRYLEYQTGICVYFNIKLVIAHGNFFFTTVGSYFSPKAFSFTHLTVSYLILNNQL